MKYLFGIIITLVFFAFPLHCQTLEEAKKLYLEGNYEVAMPAFEKAIKSAPKNASYNQWYGTCLLETGNPDEAEKYLKFAASKNILGAYSSLGKLYYIQYHFDKSVEAYSDFIALSQKRKEEDGVKAAEELLSKSKRAARMISRCENIQIIDSVIINKKDFLSAYPLSEEAGSVTVSTDLPATIVYENQLKDWRYYAKLINNQKYKLYSQPNLQGKWSDEKPLELPVDTSANDNYPYVLSDGVTIYFASTGRESIGGYDLFATRYNMNNSSYLAPEQLGMPFNSTANDYMLAIDEFNGVGYFATDRFQAEGKVIIYTYIPNEEIKTIKSEDPDTLINRAKITAIKDTWIPGADYQVLLSNIKKATQNTKPEKKKDFNFVINDNIIYYALDEFESDSAKQLFVQSENLKHQIDDLEKQLDVQRQEYAKGNKSGSSSILLNEKQLNKLYDDYQSTAVKARNAEIKHIRQQQ